MAVCQPFTCVTGVKNLFVSLIKFACSKFRCLFAHVNGEHLRPTNTNGQCIVYCCGLSADVVVVVVCLSL